MPVSMDSITVCNAHTHNLQGVSVTVPRHKLVVFTGISGSGKSSLVFDTIAAEGQRRFVESLNTYARQFIGQMEKPPVDRVEGLSPTLIIDQKTASNSPRSTVGTVTEILDYLRVLYARIGQPHCPECQAPIAAQTPQQMLDRLTGLPAGTKVQVLAPVVRGRKGEYNALFEQLRKEGFSRVRVDSEWLLLDELPADHRLARNKLHHIDVVMDRVVMKQPLPDAMAHRLSEALKKALKKTDGLVLLHTETAKKTEEVILSRHMACVPCSTSFGEMAPRLFSFNSPYGACPRCQGTGFTYEVNHALLVPDPTLSLKDGALAPLRKLMGRQYRSFVKALEQTYHLPVDTAWDRLTEAQQQAILFGPEGLGGWGQTNGTTLPDEDETVWTDLLEHFDGVVPGLKRRFEATSSPATKRYLRGFFREETCPACHGARLQPFALAVTVGGLSIHQVSELSVRQALDFIHQLPEHLTEADLLIARSPLQEVEKRLRFLHDVGLEYLHLGRRASTLSGGEAQRIRLASQIGSGLAGVLYVLDEPTIGLHPYNNEQLIQTLKALRDRGNSVLVVEHDEDMIRQADWLVDVGPKAGRQGGKILASGAQLELAAHPDSLTGDYLSGKRCIPANRTPRKGIGEPLALSQVTLHNLKAINVAFPVGAFSCVTGLSGSGKSTLIFDCLLPALRHYNDPDEPRLPEMGVLGGAEAFQRIIVIDQKPIGRTSRSTPATYTGMMEPIRQLFAGTELAKMRGYKPSQFSFNVKGGRCEACKGAGEIDVEMKFLPNATVICEVCHGRRFSPETLEVRYNGLSIWDVLNLSIQEAYDFFTHAPLLQQDLQVLRDIGLDYIQLGQPAPTLSGGEAQRIKLATELMRFSRQPTLYLMDEPSIGLHWYDLDHLLTMLHRLVDAGHTVIAIEHNSDFVKSADYLVDLGPGGGEHGGHVVATGAPGEVAQSSASLTGQYLRPLFN